MAAGAHEVISAQSNNKHLGLMNYVTSGLLKDVKTNWNYRTYVFNY
jgi:hypothetical protein